MPEKDATMLSIVVLGVVVCGTALGFAPSSPKAFFTIRDVYYYDDKTTTIHYMVPRYGPKPPPNNNNNNNNRNQTTTTTTTTTTNTTSPFCGETKEEWERKDNVQVDHRKVDFHKLLDRLLSEDDPTTTELPLSIVT